MLSDRSPYDAPSVPVSGTTSTEQPMLLQVARAFGRGVAYALAIWLVFGLVYRPLFVKGPTNGGASQSAAEQQQQELMRAYEEQNRRSAAMLDESERQQKRMSAVISQQEEQAKRMNALLDNWERQGVRGK